MGGEINGNRPVSPGPTGSTTTGVTSSGTPPATKNDPKNPTSLSMRDRFERAPARVGPFEIDQEKLEKIAAAGPERQVRSLVDALKDAPDSKAASERLGNLVRYLGALPDDQRTRILADPAVKKLFDGIVADAKSPAAKLLSGIQSGPLGDLAKRVEKGPIGDVARVIGNVAEVVQAVKPDVSVDTKNREVNVRGVTIDVDKVRDLLKKYGL